MSEALPWIDRPATSVMRAGESRTAQPICATDVTYWNSPAGGAKTGGDWCEIVALSEHAIALTIGDVAGHGTAAAATMEIMRSAIVAEIRESPADVLSLVNALAYNREGGIIVTAIVAILDRQRATLTFANAGHPPPLLVTAAEHAFLTASSGDLPLGVFRKHRAAEFVIALPADALIALYTDGITEHRRDPIRGEIELMRACRSVYERHEREAAHGIAQQVFRNGGRGTDDAAVLAVRIEPS